MSLSQKFASFRREIACIRRTIDTAVPRTKRGNRWNTIGRTRRRLAEILTAHVRAMERPDGSPRYPDASVAPEDIHPMRIAGKARVYEDAHSWEAYARWPDGTVCESLMSYDTMTEIVRAGRVLPIGKDGEVGAYPRV